MLTGARMAAPADKELEKGRVTSIKVKRYFAGQEPDYAQLDQGKTQGQKAEDLFDRGDEVLTTAIQHRLPVQAAYDPRLERLQRLQLDRDPAERRRRHLHQDDSDEDEPKEGRGQQQQQQAAAQDLDEAQAAERRAQIRQRLLARNEQENEVAGGLEVQDDDEESSSGSEYESEGDDEDDDEQGQHKLARPVYVPKGNRETVAEREAQLKEVEAKNRDAQANMEQRKIQTRAILAQTLAHEEQQAEAARRDPHVKWQEDAVNTDDEEDPEGDYEQWKVREVARIKKERDMREGPVGKVGQDDAAANSKKGAPKGKWTFMQRYWHKGAFFQDNPDDMRGTTGRQEIFQRDFSAATGGDKFDKSKLPQIMQVKHFGRAGQTKWTHLANEDTTQQQDGWYRPNEVSTLVPSKRTLGRLRGDADELARPTKKQA